MEYGNRNMDDKIRKALEGLDAPFNAGHWQQFEQKLDAADLSADDTASEEAFDSALTSKLGNLDTGVADWDNFASKLDDAEDPFDAIIAAGLTGAVASAAADWGNFEEMLTEAEAADLIADDNIIDKKVQQNLEATSTSNQNNSDRCTEPKSIIMSVDELEKLGRKYTGDFATDLARCKI